MVRGPISNGGKPAGRPRALGRLAVVGCGAMLACGTGGASGAPVDGGWGQDAALDAEYFDARAGVPDGSREPDAAHAADALDALDAADAGTTQSIAIPMYIDPSASPAEWAQVTSAAPAVSLLVANPNSGPGTVAAPEYTQAIATAHAAGQRVIGYVHTSYAARPIAQVEADIDAWYSFYGAIDGIFSDETSTTLTTVAAYYKPLFDYVKAKTGKRLVVINPGTLVDESFMQACDVAVTFEDTLAHYTDGTYPPNPGWVATYPPERFWHLVLSATTASDMQSAVSIARQRHAGYVYVTDQGPATAYTQLVKGAYWQAELTATAAP